MQDGLYKAEVIHRRGPWRSFEAVELVALGGGETPPQMRLDPARYDTGAVYIQSTHVELGHPITLSGELSIATENFPLLLIENFSL